MSIISTIGRKSLKVRALIFSIYLVLTIGAITMIYPFWLMISGTGKCMVDVSELKLIPTYLVDDDTYYRKTVCALFNEQITWAQDLYDYPISDFRTLDIPKDLKEKLSKEWNDFLVEKHFPFYYFFTGHSHAFISNGTKPENFRNFKTELYKEFDGDLAAMNREKNTEFLTWTAMLITERYFAARRYMPAMAVQYNVDWYNHKMTAPKHHNTYLTGNGYFKGGFIYPQYTKDIKEYNKAHGTKYKSYDEVRLTRRYPAKGTLQERKDWEFFAREYFNLFWVRVDASVNPLYRQYLAEKYGSIAGLNRVYKTKFKSFNEVFMPTSIEHPYTGVKYADFGDFLKGWNSPITKKVYKAPIKNIYLVSVDFLFADHLKKKFKNIAALNKALDTKYASFDEILPPQREYHYKAIMADKDKQRWEFITRNFKVVVDYVALQGRGIINTTIYCVLAVLCALIFNPLAAYALSRFQLPSTYKILLFLMLTMAFPQMVTQIPNFLMMRELGLLNTFGALVLPGLANGYSIFLLKGFFDSLPKELYESAMLDGASETRIFLQITMSLSKPILAVIALNAFTHAYSNFMMALLICQDPKMWTLMPWLYQMQMSSCQGIVYCSLLVAAIPTFIIFMLCQNVIMRGIVVPVEK